MANKKRLSVGLKNFVKDLRVIPKRTLILVLIAGLVVFFSVKYSYKMSITENQYLWVLGSYVQGFSAFTAIIVASLALVGTGKMFRKKIHISNLDRIFFMPILASLLTVGISIIGMPLYSLIIDTKIVGMVIMLSSMLALWCIGEVFTLIMKFAFKD